MATKPDGSSRVRPALDEQSATPSPVRRRGYQRQGLGETALKAFARSIASSIGRIIARALLGRTR